MWTMVGGGLFPHEKSIRPTFGTLPEKAEWIVDAAVTFDPENNKVTTKKGEEVRRIRQNYN